jgi:hypothetical protein
VQEGIAAMTPQQRVQRIVSLTVLSHAFALAAIKSEYPNESARQHRLRLAARTIDAATMKAAFGWPNDRRE